MNFRTVIAKITALPVAIRLFIVLGPSLLLVSLFAGYLVEVGQYVKLANKGPSQIIPPVISTEAIVIITGDSRIYPAAMQLMKDRGTPLLYIGGDDSTLNVANLIRQVWGSAVDIKPIEARVIWNKKPATTLAVAQAAFQDLKPRGITRELMAITDLYIPRCLIQFKIYNPGVEVIPFAVPSGVNVDNLAASNLAKLWWEFLKNLIWDVLYIVKRI